jgi:DNA-directed RNA polymerase specialized sigma24 family protein
MFPKHSHPQTSEIYPESPGWRDPTTSREAAERIAGRAASLRELVRAVIASKPSGISVHEIAGILEVPVATIQPRVSELRRLGDIKPSGERCKNESGASAHRWILRADVSGEG